MPYKLPVIDVHAHILVPEVLDFAFERSQYAMVDNPTDASGRPAPVPDGLLRLMTDVKARLAEMDKYGVDIQVISPSLLQQSVYWAEPEEGLKYERIDNERIAETVAAAPDRLIGLGSVPLQDASLAAGELERCMGELGLKGVTISSEVGDRELGDPSLRPFWKKADELGAVIFIHPAGSGYARLGRHKLMYAIGQPLEEAIAMTSLVYDGVMDELPGLKILIGHGGGYLPYYACRHDDNFRRNFYRANDRTFSTYVPQFYYDSVVFDPDMLEFLVLKAGASHVLAGTDFPFCPDSPADVVRAAKISKADQDAIIFGNAAKMFGIPH